jgi:hypothetical protein
MEERRRTIRHRVFKAGTIRFNKAGAINCIVKNLSPVGAYLEIESLAQIPDEFTLAISKDQVTKECAVIWRDSHKMGVQFNLDRAADPVADEQQMK